MNRAPSAEIPVKSAAPGTKASTMPSDRSVPGRLAWVRNSKRGRVQGVEPQAGGNQKINALVPMSEMLTYANQLTSLTSGRGLYSMEFALYEELPSHLAQKILAEREAQKKEKAEEK
jgi:elongation factor G